MRFSVCHFQPSLSLPAELAGERLSACPLSLTHLPKHGEKPSCPCEYLNAPPGWPMEVSPCTFPKIARPVVGEDEQEREMIPMGPEAVEWARGQGLPVAEQERKEDPKGKGVTTLHRNPTNGHLVNAETGESRPGLTSAEHSMPTAATATATATDVGGLRAGEAPAEPKRRRGRPPKNLPNQTQMFSQTEPNGTPKESEMSTATAPLARSRCACGGDS